MVTRPLLSVQYVLGDLPDPRIERMRRLYLLDIITIAVGAVISGAGSWRAVEHYGLAHRDWLATFSGVPNGIPSHDTFGRVFRRLDPEAFEACVLRWVQSLIPDLVGHVIAIDSIVVRRSHRRTRGGVRFLVGSHMASCLV